MLSGLRLHTGATNNIVRDVSITCSQVRQDGTVGASETLYVAGSLTEPQMLQTVSCAPGELISRMDVRSGAGIDALTVFCQQPVCS